MKLEPVFLLAPKPKPPSIPTRRAFLLAGGMFAVGTAIGGACGYSIGISDRGDAASAGGEPELKPSGDADLDELRRLAVKAPIDELFEKAVPFLSLRVNSYRDDAAAWTGIDRLSKEIIENPNRVVNPMVIGLVMGQIEGGAPSSQVQLFDRIHALRLRKEEARKRK